MQRFFTSVVVRNSLRRYSTIKTNPVVGPSVLNSIGENNYLHIINDNSLRPVNSALSNTSSHGFKLIRPLPDGNQEMYFFKSVNKRKALIKELIAGALARELFGEVAPNVCAVEIHADKSKKSQYGVLSQDLDQESIYNSLEDWITEFKKNKNKLNFSPKQLGCALAFKLLIGDSNIKAANFGLSHQEGYCYPIDNKHAFNFPAQFILDANSAIQKLKDFQSHSAGTPFTILQMDKKLRQDVLPILTSAVEYEIDTNAIARLYYNIANLSPCRLRGLFNQFGPLINKEEQAALLDDLQCRQKAAFKFLQTHEISDIQIGLPVYK